MNIWRISRITCREGASRYTHVSLVYAGRRKASGTARALIDDPANKKFVSPASYWEIAIKVSIGRYSLNQPYDAFMDRGIRGNGFVILPIEPRHTALLITMPYHHRDPFDRLLAANRSSMESIS